MLYEQRIPQQYEGAQEGIFKIRYAKDEKPDPRALRAAHARRGVGLDEDALRLRADDAGARRALREREHFSVRTSGLPNIGIQGVCFGHVVAAMSPKSEPFNWGNVLWHELGHVFAIQLSKNHVPRWFTEGLSEYETIIRRPEWQRELDPELYVALKGNRLPGAVDMNRAFTHADGDPT